MADSKTYRISSIISAVAVALVVAFVACPSRHHSKPGQPTLQSVEVTPTNPTIALGTTQQFTATGTYSDGSTLDLTELADWTSTDAAGDVSTAAGTRGKATSLAMGSTTITATYSGMSGSTTLTISSAALVSVEVTPTNPSIALGTSQQFTATGIFTDGTTQDLSAQVQWDSFAAGTSTISNDAGSQGLAQSLGLGDTAITATLTGISGSTTLTVTNAVLVSVEVTPTNPSIALGTNQQFAATGIFTDGTTQDLTAEVQWDSSATGSSTVSNDVGTNGFAQSVGLGDATITATYSGMSGSTTLTVTNAAVVSVEVTPTNPSIALGTYQQFAATGIFTDGTTQDLTAEVQWDSSATGSSTISNAAGTNGFAQSVGLGNTTITATYSGTSGSTTLTITNAVLVSVEVTPTNPSIALGLSQQFTAMGTFSDGTIQDITADVLWESSDGTAQVSNAAATQGLAESVAVGSATISATHSGLAGSTTLTISNAALVSIAVTPALPVIALGTTQTFTATGTYTDGSVQDVTAQVLWSSSNESVSIVENADGSQGLASSIAMGTATIQAQLSGLSASTTLEVSNPALVSIEVTPSHPAAALGTTQAFVATGIYSDGSTQDITNEVTWSTLASEVATVSNADGSRGLATTVTVGSTTLAADLEGKSGSTLFTVSSAALVAIAVSPDVSSLAAGTSQTFSALGILSDGTRQDLTTQVTWSSSNDSVATVSGAAGSQGLVTGLTVGNITISAVFSGIGGSATIDVSSATLDSIDITPFVTSIAKGTQLQFSALGNYSDGSTQDLTALVTWSSSVDGIAAISNAAGSQGLGTGVGVGATTITAAFSGVQESVDLDVTAALLEAIQLTPLDPSVPAGLGLTLQATGVFSDASTQDITALVTWSSSDHTVATVSNAAGSEGFVQSVGSGTTVITALQAGHSATTTLTVTSATLVSISVTPVGPSIPAGYSLSLEAVGDYSDGSSRSVSTEVLWSSSSTTVAKISNSLGTEGRVTGLVPGTTTLSATMPGGFGTTFLTVTNEHLSSIEVEPDPLSLLVGETWQVTATGYFSGGFVMDITSQVSWKVTPRSVANIGNSTTTKGLVTAKKAGNTTIRASRDGKTGTAPLSVTKP